VFVRCGLRLIFQSPCLIVGSQTLDVVAVWAVAAEGVFIEQTLDSAAGADLVGDSLGANRPTHFAMPAAAENDRRSGHAGRQQAHGPQPPGTLGFLRVLILLGFHHKPFGLLFRICRFRAQGNHPMVG